MYVGLDGESKNDSLRGSADEGRKSSSSCLFESDIFTVGHVEMFQEMLCEALRSRKLAHPDVREEDQSLIEQTHRKAEV